MAPSRVADSFPLKVTPTETPAAAAIFPLVGNGKSFFSLPHYGLLSELLNVILCSVKNIFTASSPEKIKSFIFLDFTRALIGNRREYLVSSPQASVDYFARFLKVLHFS